MGSNWVDSGSWTARKIQGDLDPEGDSSPGGVPLRVVEFWEGWYGVWADPGGSQKIFF
jgi:hypothetical protein